MFASGLMFTMWFIEDTHKTKRNLIYGRAIFTVNVLAYLSIEIYLKNKKGEDGIWQFVATMVYSVIFGSYFIYVARRFSML